MLLNDRVPNDVSTSSVLPYAAFISYSRAVDGMLAPALAKGLQLFAKPWYRRRALRVFRDDDVLSTNPSLWSSVQEGLDGSEFFILLASPEAARSKWVDKEITYWLAHRPAANLLIVVTDGDIAWNAQEGDFDREKTTCLPSAVYGAFPDEPRWTDLRTVRHEQDLSLRMPAFRDLVADLAATLRHVPKDEIFGEDLTQHRHMRWLVRATAAVLTVITLVAALAAAVAVDRAGVADEQRRIAEDGQRAAVARQLEAQTRESISRDPRTALRLALAAHEVHPDRESQANLHRALTATAFAGTFPGQLSGDRQGFFPDGNAFVTGGDGQAVIWDVRSAPPVKVASFAAAGTPVVSPDGRSIVTLDGVVNERGTAETWSLWDVSDRVYPVQIGQSHPIGLDTADHPLVFSADGRMLAMAGHADTGSVVHLWDVTDRDRPRVQHKLAAQAISLAFAPDGRTLAIGAGNRGDTDADMVIELWNIATPTGPIRLATKTFDSGGYVRSLEFSRDGGLLVAGGSGPQGDTHVATVLVDVTDARRPTQLGQPIPGQLSSSMATALSPTAPVLATSAGPDRAIVLWDITDRASPRMIDTLSGHMSMVRWIVFAPDGSQLITGDDDAVHQWKPFGRTSPSVTARAVSDPITPDSSLPTGLAASPNGQTLITGNENGSYLVWNIEDHARPHRLSAISPERGSYLSDAVAVSPDGRTVAIGGWTGETKAAEVSLWDIADRSRPRLAGRIPERDLGAVLALAFAPDGSTLVVGGHGRANGVTSPHDEGKLDLWNVEDSGRPTNLALIADAGTNGEVRSVTFSVDGRLVVAGGGGSESLPSSGSVRLWNVADRHRPQLVGPPLSGHNGPVNAVAVAPDGRTLATGGGFLDRPSAPVGAAILWDIANPEQPRRIGQPLVGHQGPVAGVAFAPNGLLATAGGTETHDRPGVTQLWDITDLPRVHPVGHGFTGHRGTVRAVVFTGGLLVSGGFDNTVEPTTAAVLWDMAALTQLRAEAQSRACAIAGGGLSEQEWTRYASAIPFRNSCPS